ncbi:unnamed protein product [Cuscuta epithymum]|uniref:Uncharacterized protein n=1 Tax=Cuscuta epithymum TaxID=186058 RepID=A0AAV0GIK5_9ASTE|nr:unnamed protein product [Cuscuta epithymum]
MDFPEAVPPIDHSQNPGSSENPEKKEPGELLDESWFFGNFFDRKPRISRCYSDSSMLSPGKSMEETFSSINRSIPEGRRLLGRAGGMQKTPSMPPNVTFKQEPDPAQKEDGPMIKESLRKSLLRAPSLPIFADNNGEAEEDDDESDFCMGKLIRQASLKPPKVLLRQTSLNPSRILPPRQTPKGVTRSCSVSTFSKLKNEPTESISTILASDAGEGKTGFATNYSSKAGNGHISTSQDINELHKFKNLAVSLQDKEKVSKRGNPLEEVWMGKSFGPPPKSGGAGKKSAQDMKAHIKFWARTVASNVRQEC